MPETQKLKTYANMIEISIEDQIAHLSKRRGLASDFRRAIAEFLKEAFPKVKSETCQELAQAWIAMQTLSDSEAQALLEAYQANPPHIENSALGFMPEKQRDEMISDLARASVEVEQMREQLAAAEESLETMPKEARPFLQMGINMMQSQLRDAEKRREMMENLVEGQI